ncbi:hypothetical protein [Ferrovibrio terrae]|nr:hypothetical protein [Ferrovibrio terrae]
MLPDGETIKALQSDLYDRLARYKAPTTAEVDDHHDKLARYRAGENEVREMPRTALAMPGGGLPAYVRTLAENTDQRNPEPQLLSATVSDVADAPSEFVMGTQVAQLALPIHPTMTAPATGAAGASQKLPPGVTPNIEKTSQQLEKWFDERVNLLSLPAQMYQHLANTTSPALDPSDEAASRTPPLKPSAPEDPPPEGSKAEERAPSLEDLIPPEMKPWIEGLEPFDQQLARELMLIYNRRGGPETIKGNAIIVKEMMDALKKYPALADGMKHCWRFAFAKSHGWITGRYRRRNVLEGTPLFEYRNE